jgi:PAS domain S-box-containing protein
VNVDPQQLVDQAPDAVVFADRDGVIRVWNTAAERLFGHPATEAVGRNLDLIVPERFRQAHWTGFDRALAAGVTQYVGQSLTTKAVRADGTDLYVELSFAIVLDDDGAAVGALAHARDITERYLRERAERAERAEQAARGVTRS